LLLHEDKKKVAKKFYRKLIMIRRGYGNKYRGGARFSGYGNRRFAPGVKPYWGRTPARHILGGRNGPHFNAAYYNSLKCTKNMGSYTIRVACPKRQLRITPPRRFKGGRFLKTIATKIVKVRKVHGKRKIRVYRRVVKKFRIAARRAARRGNKRLAKRFRKIFKKHRRAARKARIVFRKKSRKVCRRARKAARKLRKAARKAHRKGHRKLARRLRIAARVQLRIALRIKGRMHKFSKKVVKKNLCCKGIR